MGDMHPYPVRCPIRRAVLWWPMIYISAGSKDESVDMYTCN